MNKTKEIDVIFLLKKVLREKMLLAKFVIVFAVIGVIYALNKPKEWTSVVVLAPEASSMGMTQSLGDIANMIGLGSGGNGSVDAIYPDIYPNIFDSSDFVLALFNINVTTKDGSKKTYYNHLEKDVPVPFWSKPGVWLREYIASMKKSDAAGGSFPGELSKKDDAMYNIIRKSIECQMDKGTNLIVISATDVDPYVATTLVDTLQNRLQTYITEYRTKKASFDLEYARKMNTEAKQEYQKIRQRYISMADSNMDADLKSVTSKIEDLENEMQLKYNFYSQTSAQVEQAMMKVQESTPAFTVIQSPMVPKRASSTPRSVMVLIFMLLGCLADSAWVLWLRDYIKEIKANRK